MEGLPWQIVFHGWLDKILWSNQGFWIVSFQGLDLKRALVFGSWTILAFQGFRIIVFQALDLCTTVWNWI